MTTATKALVTVTMNLDKETKNTYRFQEDAEEGTIPSLGTIWVQKKHFTSKPEKITVTVNLG